MRDYLTEGVFLCLSAYAHAPMVIFNRLIPPKHTRRVTVIFSDVLQALLFQLIILSVQTFSPWDGVWLSYPILSYNLGTIDVRPLSPQFTLLVIRGHPFIFAKRKKKHQEKVATFLTKFC